MNKDHTRNPSTLDKIISHTLMTHVIRESLSDQIAETYTIEEINQSVRNAINDVEKQNLDQTRGERILEDVLEAYRYYRKSNVQTLKRAYTKKLMQPHNEKSKLIKGFHTGLAKSTPVHVNNNTMHGTLSFAMGCTIGRLHYSQIKKIFDKAGISEKFGTNLMLLGEGVMNIFSTMQNYLMLEGFSYVYTLATNNHINQHTKNDIINGIFAARYAWTAFGFVMNTFYDKYMSNFFMYITPSSAPVMIASKILDAKENGQYKKASKK